MTDTIPLPHRIRGEGEPPIALIHGFGADRLTWASLVKPLSKLRRVIAFDLPGHGEAVEWSRTPDAAVCAKAVAASLEAMGLSRATLVGHSLGGAVACLVALRRPELVERLVLLAPGGFGPEMNVALLRAYAAIGSVEEAAEVLAGFFGPQSQVPEPLPRLVAEQRRSEPLRASLARIVEAIDKDGGQGTLPLDDLAAGPVPITLVWGTADGVLPFQQAIDAPALIARHVLQGVGHMPHLEAPAVVAHIIAAALGAGVRQQADTS